MPKGTEIKNAYFSNIRMILLMYMRYFNTNELDPCIFSVFVSLLWDYKGIFLVRFLVGN